MESVSGSDFTFVNNNLDCYLDDLASKVSVSSKEPRACALTHLGSSESARKPQGAYSTVTREFEGPKSISCFDYEIKLSSPVVNSIKTKFAQEPCGVKNIQVLSNLRFPPKLKTCYVKDFDFEREALEFARSKRPRNRRRSRRTRYSLSENVHVNDDYRRSNLLPTDDDLRTAYDKVFPCRAIPYIFGCAENSNSTHKCAARCAEKVKGFRIFIEVPQDGRQLPPIVSENLEKIRNDSGVVDDVSAMVAATALRTTTPSNSRMFVPLSQDLADKIGVLSEVFDVDDEPTVEDPEVCRAVEDMVEFVDRQTAFPVLDYDPDASLDDSFTLDCSKEDVSQNPNDVSDDGSTASPRKVRKKKRTEKNRVVRELKKLLNISVKDEDEGESNAKADICDEPTCVLGCVCASLNVKPPPTEHCGQANCFFGCSCTEKKYFYVSEGDLAKEEKSWHQTVVRKKGNAVELQSGLERSKRQSKLPSKYEDTFTGQHFDHIVRPRRRDRERLDEDLEAEMEKYNHSLRSRRGRRRVNDELKPDVQSAVESPVDDLDDSSAPKILWTEDTNRKRSESLKKKCSELKKSMLATRLVLCGAENVKTLDQVFIWCTVHDKYDCHCSNFVVMTRNSNLLLKAARTNRYTAKRMLSQRSLKNMESPENGAVKLWDEKHSARTAGALVNYSIRNKTGVYKRMMKRVLLDAKVSSFSNGFLKIRPVPLIPADGLYDNFPLSGLPSYGIGTVTHIPTGRNLIVAPEPSLELSDNEGHSKAGSDSLDAAPEIVPMPKERSNPGSDFMDVSSVIVPMPRKRVSESFESCLSFSMLGRNVKKPRVSPPMTGRLFSSSPRPELPTRDETCKPKPALIDDNTPVQLDPDSADSDVEFVEEPMEVLSIKSSSDDDGDIDDGKSKDGVSSTNQTSTAPSDSLGHIESVCSLKSIKIEPTITIESDEEHASAGHEDDAESHSDGSVSAEENSSSSSAPSGSQPTPGMNSAPSGSQPTPGMNSAPSGSQPTPGMNSAPSGSQPTPGMNSAPSGSQPTTGMNSAPSGSQPTPGMNSAPSGSQPTPGMNSAPSGSQPTPGMNSAPSGSQPTPVPEKKIEEGNVEEEYPLFGLCNLKHKEFGYIPLMDTTGTKLQVLIPGYSHCSRSFSDAKEASKFMVTVVEKYLKIQRSCQSGEWCKVTRGVLKKLNVKRFPNHQQFPESAASLSKPPVAAKLPSATEPPLEPHKTSAAPERHKTSAAPERQLPAVKGSSLPNLPPQAPPASTHDKKKPKVTIENEKQLIRSFPLPRAQTEGAKSSTAPSSSAPPVSGSSETAQGLTTSEKNPRQSDTSSDSCSSTSSVSSTSSSNSSSSTSDDDDKSMSTFSAPPVNRPAPGSALVGTFSNMSEANSFLQKNFSNLVQSQMVRTSSPTVSYTSLKSITSPGCGTPATSTNPPPPTPAVPVGRGKTMLIPTSAFVSRFPGVKLPTNAPGLVKVASGQYIRCALVRAPAQAVGASGGVITKITAVEPSPAAKATVTTSSANPSAQNVQSLAGPVRMVLQTRPNVVKGRVTGQRVKLAGPGTILLGAPPPSAAGKLVHRAVPPRADMAAPFVRVKPPSRRAEVIVARDTGFATVISPAPAQAAPSPKTVPTDSRVVYNGVVITKPDTPKPEPPKAVICDKNTASNFKSLLPQRSPPKTADPPQSSNP